MDKNLINQIDKWLERPGPQQHIVVSSRVRYMRNLENFAFPPRASNEELAQIGQLIGEVVEHHEAFEHFSRLELSQLAAQERICLKESFIISAEMERGDQYRLVYISPDANMVLMVNEEDHLRMYCMRTGFQLFPLLGEMNHIDDILSERLPYAYHEQFGYLAACPTNTGTGIRGSVMLHLPGLVLMQEIGDVMRPIPEGGMTVRGFYGENSEHLGDYYQISNEQTLGQKEDEIIQKLINVVERVIKREEEARSKLHEKDARAVEDMVWRSLGTLTFARQISSQESMQLLSRIRLGIDYGQITDFGHARLNRLMVSLQPAHLALNLDLDNSPAKRDIVRAQLLRETFKDISSMN